MVDVKHSRVRIGSCSWSVRLPLRSLFSGLFKVPFKKLRERVLFKLVLTSVIQDEFLVVRDLLTSHGHPNFTIGSKLRRVVDKAQVEHSDMVRNERRSSIFNQVSAHKITSLEQRARNTRFGVTRAIQSSSLN